MYNAQQFTSAPGDFNTIKAVGKNVPDINGQTKLGKYCKIPCGKTVGHHDVSVRLSTPLHFNEYIVFDQDRIRIKFIVHCERDIASSSSSSYAASLTAIRSISSGPTKNRSVTVSRPLRSTVTSSSLRMTSSQYYALPSSRGSSLGGTNYQRTSTQNPNAGCVIL